MVHGWIILLDEIYLRKVGWIFPWVWGFPRIKSCDFLCLFMLLIFSVHDIIVNLKRRSKNTGKSIALKIKKI
jgi:hypothetical protein